MASPSPFALGLKHRGFLQAKRLLDGGAQTLPTTQVSWLSLPAEAHRQAHSVTVLKALPHLCPTSSGFPCCGSLSDKSDEQK